MNGCEITATCEPDFPRQVHVAPLACTVYIYIYIKKNNVLPRVKNSKILYKSLGLGPEGERYCDYLATFSHGTYWSCYTAPPHPSPRPPSTGANVLLGFWFYFLSDIRTHIPYMCPTKKGKVWKSCLEGIALAPQAFCFTLQGPWAAPGLMELAHNSHINSHRVSATRCPASPGSISTGVGWAS